MKRAKPVRVHPAILLVAVLATMGYSQTANPKTAGPVHVAAATRSTEIGYSPTEDPEVRRLRRLVAGIRYDTVLFCLVIPKGVHETYAGCNEKERRRGKNWMTLQMPPVQWDFAEDGTARLYRLVGFPEPGGGIRWTCGRDEQGREQPAWFQMSQDAMHVVFSCDRPPDDAYYRPAVRYEYNDLSVGR